MLLLTGLHCPRVSFAFPQLACEHVPHTCHRLCAQRDEDNEGKQPCHHCPANKNIKGIYSI